MASTSWRDPRQLLSAGAYVCLLGAGAYYLLRYAHATSEDAWISFKYARNLADGYGLVSNVGDPPEEGYSNLTWVLLLAGLRRVFHADIVWSAKLLGLCSMLALVGLVHWFVREYFARLEAACDVAPDAAAARRFATLKGWAPPAFSLAAAAALLFSRHAAIWVGSGLETAFYAGLVLLIAAFTVHAVTRQRYDRSSLVAVLAFVSWNTRPEGLLNFVVAFALIGGWAVARGDFDRKTGFALLRGCVWFGVLAIALLVAKKLYFGDVLANPARVKLALSSLSDRAGYFRDYLVAKGWPFGAMSALALLSLIALLIHQRRTRAGRDLCGLLVCLAGFYASQIFFILYSGADYMAFSRFFFTHFALLGLLILFAPTAWLVLGSSVRVARLPALAGALSAATLVHSALWAEPVSSMSTWAELGFVDPRVLQERQATGYYKAAAKLAELMQGRSDYYALSEFGYVPYHVPAKGLDMMGLNQRQIARNHKYYPRSEAMAASRDFVLSKLPHVIVTGHYWRDEAGVMRFPDSVSWFSQTYFDSRFFLDHYTTDVPREPGHDWIFSHENGTYVPVSSIRSDDIKNHDKLLYGFKYESSRIVAGPLARVLLRPDEHGEFLELAGYLPENANAPGGKCRIRLSYDGEAVGDRLFAEKELPSSGSFVIRVPTSKRVFVPGADAIVTITTDMARQNGDRGPRFIFEWVGFLD